MKPHAGENAAALGGQGQDRHADELWELELAEQAHERQQEAALASRAGGRLEHYLQALLQHYAQRTPQELSVKNLPVHAKYLSHRYQRIADHLRQMIAPGGERRELAHHYAQHETAWRIHFKNAADAHARIRREMLDSVRYWAWVRAHARLPSRWWLRLARYSRRPVAHPWTSISAAALESFAQLDARIDRHDVAPPRHTSRWRLQG